VSFQEVKESSSRRLSSAIELQPDDGAEFDYFGSSVDVDGDTVLVGSPNDNGFNGSAYVYVRAGSNWALQGKLEARDGAVGDSFGKSVALNGDTAVIGAWPCTVNGNVGQGCAYVFCTIGKHMDGAGKVDSIRWSS
jgi:hypothetical protein